MTDAKRRRSPRRKGRLYTSPDFLTVIKAVRKELHHDLEATWEHSRIRCLTY